MKKVMYFLNPEFKEKSNITVRRGPKWSSCLETIEVRDIYGKILGETEIVQTMSIKFCEMPKPALKLNHDPNCRTYDGLLNMMRKVYPQFQENEIVTLVFFNKVG